MKKTGLLLLLVASLACAQSTPMLTSTMAATPGPNGTVETSVSHPFVRFQTPTQADIYCAGFISKDRVPDANYVNGGLETPTDTKFELGEMVYLAGTGYQAGQLYSVVRELRDVNQYEIYSGMRKMLGTIGHPYGEIGRIRVLDTRNRSAIAQVEFSCDPINPGDVVTPFVKKARSASTFPPILTALPANGKLTGRVVLGKDFDTVLGAGMKLYLERRHQPGRQSQATISGLCVLTPPNFTIRSTRCRSRPRFPKTRKCIRPPLRATALPEARVRTSMWGICPGARLAKWS